MARRLRRTVCITGGGTLAFVALSGVASAQEVQVAPSAIPLAGSSTAAPAAAPRVVAVKEAPAEPEGTDHDLFVHHIAVGYFGISQLPVGVSGAMGSSAETNVNAPVIGIRYWATRMIGIDAGIGFGYTNNSVNGAPGSSNSYGFAFHGGLPLILADAKHFSFEVVPIEATVGFTGGGTPVTATISSSLSGLRLDIGGRVGAELTFGFIGVPQLALEGSIGLFLDYRSWSFSTPSVGRGMAAVTGGGKATQFSTSVGSDPWAIFTDTISALYYF